MPPLHRSFFLLLSATLLQATVPKADAQMLAKDIVQTELDRCERNMKAVRTEIGNRIAHWRPAIWWKNPGA